MKENKKKQYLTPMVERLEARVERGFEGSLAPTGSNEDLISSGEVHGGSDFDQGRYITQGLHEPVVADLQSATTDYKDLQSVLN